MFPCEKISHHFKKRKSCAKRKFKSHLARQGTFINFALNLTFMIMKRIIFFLAIVLPLVFSGCNPSKNNSQHDNQQQKSFADFLSKYNKLSYNQSNEIQRNEFEKEFEKQLENYIDTTNLFINWKGKIDNIKINEYGKAKEITFEIKYEPEQHREITFNISYLVNNDSLSTDYIYNKIKPIANYSTVYFDGFIKRNKDNSVDYYMPSLFEEHIVYPHYKFYILDIDTQPIQGKSKALNECVNAIFQSIRNLPRYTKSDDVLFMESNGHKIIPNDATVQSKREEFVCMLNENGYQNLYTQLSNADKQYCSLLLGYVISQWRFDEF